MNYIWGSSELAVFDRLIPVDDIVTGKNVRSDVGDLVDLVSSIKEVGIINPLVVSEGPEGVYTLVAGERRLEAARIAGMLSVPCKVFRDLSDSQLYEIMLAENFNRESMNAIDEGRAFRMMLDKYGYTQEKLGSIVGRSQSYIANHLRLLDLPQGVQDLIVDGTISPAHAMQFLSLRDSSIYDILVDYFLKNIPKQIKPVPEFKAQIVAPAYSAVKDAGRDVEYVSIYTIGQEAYSSKCRECTDYIGGYCYNKTCLDVLRKAHKDETSPEEPSDSFAEHNAEVARIIKGQKRQYLSDLQDSIENDIDSVLRDSCLDAKGLFDRFLLSFLPPDEDEDSRASLGDIIGYDSEDYVLSRLDAGSSLDDLVRLLCGALILWEFNDAIDYDTEGEMPKIYSNVLRNHGLSSSVFTRARIKAIQTDFDVFDKRIEDAKDSDVPLPVDVSDLPKAGGDV